MTSTPTRSPTSATPTGNYQRLTFLFDTEDRARFDQTLFKLKKFLIDHVKCWDDNGSGNLKEGIANAVGHKFSGVIRWRADKVDPEVQYSEISKTAPVRYNSSVGPGD